MSELGIVMVTFLVCLSAITGIAITIMQRTIDRLTDKLMARDYREYRVYSAPEEKAVEHEDDKLSYFDQ